MGKYELIELKGPDWLTNVQKILISALISSRPEIRPSCEAILEHSMFWSCDKILNFFQVITIFERIHDRCFHVVCCIIGS